jgi:hypothetical protein
MAGPSQAIILAGSSLKQATVSSSTPSHRPRQPACCSHLGTCTVTEQNRQTIGGHHGTNGSRSIAVRGISAFRSIGFSRQLQHRVTMNLFQPDRFRRQVPRSKQTLRFSSTCSRLSPQCAPRFKTPTRPGSHRQYGLNCRQPRLQAMATPGQSVWS